MGIFDKRSSNPVLTFEGIDNKNGYNSFDSVVTSKRTFSKGGVGLKVLVGIGIMVATLFALLSAPQFTLAILENYTIFVIGTSIAIIILVMIGRMKPQYAKIVFFAYSILEGVLIGILTIIFNTMIPGIAFMAFFLTVCDVLFMTILYAMYPSIVTDKFKGVMFSAIGAISIFYLVSFVYSLIAKAPLIEYTSPLSIMISVVVVIIASLTLLLDFDLIEKYRKRGVSKEYEWVAALGLLVTIVWIYLEILRLLSKLRRD